MDIRLNPDPLPHQQAAANLYIEGLAAMFFNHRQRTWDVAFLRDTKHDFTLTIKNNGYQQVCPTKIDLNTSRIEVYATKPVTPNWNQYPNGFWFHDSFSRTSTTNHPKDFRWVVDLSNRTELPLHVAVWLRPRPGKGRTVLTIGDAIFYTEAITSYELMVAPFGTALMRRFGKINELIGTDINCESGGEVVIKIDGRECDRLPYVPGSPYTITLSNHEPATNIIPDEKKRGNYKMGDFRLYYDLVGVLGQYDMFCPQTIIRTRDCDCETVQVSALDRSGELPEDAGGGPSRGGDEPYEQGGGAAAEGEPGR
jgi:hypothetical protein